MTRKEPGVLPGTAPGPWTPILPQPPAAGPEMREVAGPPLQVPPPTLPRCQPSNTHLFQSKQGVETGFNNKVFESVHNSASLSVCVTY